MLSEKFKSHIWLLSDYFCLLWWNVKIFDDSPCIVLFRFVLWDQRSWLFKGRGKVLTQEYKWRLNKTTHCHLKRRLQSMDLAPMSTMTLSGLEIRHRGAPKGGVCRPAARPHKIEIKKSDFQIILHQRFYVIYTLADIRHWNPLIMAFEFWNIK